MRKKASLPLLITLLFTIGCQTISGHENTPSPQIFSQPLLTHWELVGNPGISQSGFKCVINGYYLISGKIYIFYSLSGIHADELISDYNLQIIDDLGETSELTEITPLTDVDGIEIGLMLFEPRHISIRELYLTITNKINPDINNKIFLAKLIGSTNDDYFDRIFFGEPVNKSELDGFLISILWSASPEAQVKVPDTETPAVSYTVIPNKQATSTLVVLQPLMAIPPDVYIIFGISFQIEDKNNGQIQYLSIQLLSNGSSIIKSNGTANLAKPILLITPIPSATPNPQPMIPYPPPPTPPYP